jgi:hypothetical protein
MRDKSMIWRQNERQVRRGDAGSLRLDDFAHPLREAIFFPPCTQERPRSAGRRRVLRAAARRCVARPCASDPHVSICVHIRSRYCSPLPDAQAVLSPHELAEELLQRARRNTRIQSDRLNAFLGKVRQLPPDLDARVCSRVFATDAIVEEIEEFGQRRLQLADLVHVHALPSGNPWQDTVSPRRGNKARST